MMIDDGEKHITATSHIVGLFPFSPDICNFSFPRFVFTFISTSCEDLPSLGKARMAKALTMTHSQTPFTFIWEDSTKKTSNVS
jgi:hypothetical protein